MARARGWCFTLNNYSNDDVRRIGDLRVGEGEYFKYIGYGREVGESGTPHLQGYLYTNNPASLTGVRKRIPRAHFEVSKGRPDQAIAYCEKDGEYIERGERPVSQQEKGKREIERWDAARDAAKKGKMDDIPSDIYIRHYASLKNIVKDHLVVPDDCGDVCGVWITGEAGVGKSRKAREDYPSAYFKMANKWWDGYMCHKYVILDDIGKEHSCLGHHLKIWSDRYSFIAENKGGAIMIRPEKFVVTSQYRIEDIFEDEETRAALNRRFDVIVM